MLQMILLWGKLDFGNGALGRWYKNVVPGEKKRYLASESTNIY